MYERFFGLVDAPFRLTPDPRYLYRSRKHAEALAHLRLGLSESSGFVCITGDVGTGKTTLLRTFLEEIDTDVTSAYIYNPAVSHVELLQRINSELGLPSTSTSQVELVDALNAHLLRQRRSGGLSVVVVDEAQAFSIEVLEQLRLLSNLETTTEKLLRVILVGQPQLGDLLCDPSLVQLNQRITLRWHMGPLSARETVGYVRHRMSVASRGKNERIFTLPALLVIHRLSGGVPRLVNMIAHRALLAAYVVRRRRVGAATVWRAYREIGAVPLTRPRSAWRRGLAAAALAVAVGVGTLGAPRLGWPPDLPGLGTTPAPVPVALLGSSDLVERLGRVDVRQSARTAAAAILAAWHVRPLEPDESAFPGDLDRVAWRRGLDDLALAGNLSMLRLLDLPAVVELDAGDGSTRWAALTGLDDRRAVLIVAGETVAVDPTVLARHWSGQAHVVWRDFEGLGPTLSLGARGSEVERLQALLRRAGMPDAGAAGEFDAATASAVQSFQRARLLDADGRVGRLTRIVLYAAAGGYARPTLTAAGQSPERTAAAPPPPASTFAPELAAAHEAAPESTVEEPAP